VFASSGGASSVALGDSSLATQAGAVAVGEGAHATGVNAIAIGHGAVATGSVAVGNGASAANGGAAYGDNSVATGANAAALGTGASATGANSVAIGSNSVATAANTVSFGSAGAERVLTNVAPGAVAAGSTNAVNGGQLFGVQTTANAALALGQNSVQYDNPAHTSATLNPGGSAATLHNVAAGVAPTDAANVSQLTAFGTGLKSSVFSGIAAGVAMGTAPTPSAPGKTTLSLSSGFFENYTGIGLAFAHRLDTETPLNIEGGFAHAGGENVGRVGLSVEF